MKRAAPVLLPVALVLGQLPSMAQGTLGAGASVVERGTGVPGAPPSHLFVDRSAVGAGDGSSWADAFSDLALALGAARAGTRLFVAGGTYLPDSGTGDPSRHFDVPSDVELLGGYAGLAGTRTFEHDPVLHPTILSGDLLGDDGPGFTGRGDNSIGVAWVGGGARNRWGLVADVVVRGSEGSSAVFVYGRSRFLRCRFEDNRAVYRGGGLYAVADLRLVDCEFEGNVVELSAGTAGNPGGGGGLCVGSFSGGLEVVLRRCRFEANRVEVKGASPIAHHGGGMFFASGFPSLDALLVVDGHFEGNQLRGPGAAQGGGLDTQADSELLRCDFVGNRIEGAGANTSRGGGMGSGDVAFGAPTNEARIVSCRFLGNAIDLDLGPAAVTIVELQGGGAWVAGGTLQNVLAAGNRLDLMNPGGALGRSVVGSGVSGDSLDLRGVTLARNASTWLGPVGLFGGPVGGGLATDGFSSAINTILWENDSAGSTGEEDQIRVFGAGSLSIDSSCVQGWSGGLGGVGNVGSDPAFVDPDGADGMDGTLDDDYRLGPLSPVADAGDDGGIDLDVLDVDADGDRAEPLPLDLFGRAREQDHPLVPTTGSGEAPVVDMGALEGPG